MAAFSMGQVDVHMELKRTPSSTKDLNNIDMYTSKKLTQTRHRLYVILFYIDGQRNIVVLTNVVWRHDSWICRRPALLHLHLLIVYSTYLRKTEP